MVSRNRAWADTRVLSSTIANSGRSITNLLVDAPTVDTLTAVRIVGSLHAHFDFTSNPVDGEQIIDIGIGVASLEAFNVGFTALPSPRESDEYPPRGWLYVATKPVLSLLAVEGVLHESAIFNFDLRASRKIDKGVLFMFISNIVGRGVGTAILVTGRVRVLCLT